jgi:hypothetical protein
VKLDAKQLADILAVLERIDGGLARPRVPDRLGRFLRQYERSRGELDGLVSRCGLDRRQDGAISGRAVGAIDIHPLLPPEVSILDFPLGEVARTVAVSDQLGGIMGIAMWLKGPVANAAYTHLNRGPGIRLNGDYRWTPPGRLTPGEANVEPLTDTVTWQNARCLKVVADDLDRPPHALEYLVDYRLGPPSLKSFRTVCAVKKDRGWLALPGVGQPRVIEIAAITPSVRFEKDSLYAFLIYGEPWSRGWTIAAAAPVDEHDAIAHSITWADFTAELSDGTLAATTVAGVRDALRACGVRTADIGHPVLTRSLLPPAKEILRFVRGVG